MQLSMVWAENISQSTDNVRSNWAFDRPYFRLASHVDGSNSIILIIKYTKVVNYMYAPLWNPQLQRFELK